MRGGGASDQGKSVRIGGACRKVGRVGGKEAEARTDKASGWSPWPVLIK